MTRLYVTSNGGWSLREFGAVSKVKVKHPGMIDSWAMSGYVLCTLHDFE